jgi:hypothetical protein
VYINGVENKKIKKDPNPGFSQEESANNLESAHSCN